MNRNPTWKELYDSRAYPLRPVSKSWAQLLEEIELERIRRAEYRTVRSPDEGEDY